MTPMTTQQLGQRPGRARLGAAPGCSRAPFADAYPVADVATVVGAASWRREPSVPTTHANATPACDATAVMGTATGLGFGSIKRTARHLGTRST